MANVVMMVSVPEDIYQKVRGISKAYQSDFNTDMVHLLETYISSYQKLLSDPAAKVLLEVNS